MNSKLFYVLGLAVIVISFFLLIQFPESKRANLIAGILLPCGIGLNIAGYSTLSDKQKQ